MVNITPRSAEVKALAELLESGEYETAEALAKAVFKLSYDLMLDRDWHLYGMRFSSGPTVVCWGPFSSEKEAERFAGKLTLAADDAVVNMAIPIFSVNRQLAKVIEADTPPDRNPMCRCGHPKGIHEHDKAMGRCQYRGCGCTKIVLREEQ